MKTFYTLLLSIALIAIGKAQSFYEIETIQTIEVTFAESNWDQLMDAAYAADAGYVMAQSVAINGIQFDSVGVKYKGNSSYNANQVKNPWHIELDTYKDQDYDGYTDIKLANGAKDPSVIRDVLGYQIIRQYMEAPQANFANLYVNGNLIGLYANTESVSKKFVNSRFGSKNNTRFKCSPPEGAGPTTTALPNLEYLGQETSAYTDAYELKSDEGWQDLIDLCDTLVNHTDEIEQMLDVNRALWMLAFDNVIVNLDSYIGNFAQNYYLYRSDEGQFLPVVWDLNESFGVFSQTGSSNLNNTTSKQQMSHLLHENDSDYPLVRQLLSVPMYQKMYLAHMKTLLLENFDNGLYLEMGTALQETIDEAVQADDNKFYTYDNFIDNLTVDVGGGGPGGPGGGGQSAPGIANLMNGRTAYLLGQSDFTHTEPKISDIQLTDSSPILAESITITVVVSDATHVYLGYRDSSLTAPFTRVQMYDDGAHHDGAAGDGVFGVDITLDHMTTEYFIYAENDDIGMFSPRRAEYEFYKINAQLVIVNDDIVINEFMASNDATVADQDGEFEDWIELYNNGTETVDLSDFFLSDDGGELGQWAFPEGTEIAPDSYLIIWADNDDDQDGLHANFKLSGSGESLILSTTEAADTIIVDMIAYPEQSTDISYARLPNGIGDFQSANPTFNMSNNQDCAAAGGDMDNDGICADEDCDDNDASVGAISPEGSSCDDGNQMTQNDVIQSDGCTCVGTAVEIGDVVINEFMSSNETTITDADGEFEDWIEIYNNGTSSVDLSGYFLTDDSDDLAQWAFPAGTVIGPNDYLIVWADGDVDQEGLHANFRLSASGESVILTEPDMTIVDAIDYPEQSADISYGRFPNGTGLFQSMAITTFNDENMGTSSTSDLSDNKILNVYPNPADSYLTLEVSNSDQKKNVVTIYNAVGTVVFQDNVLGKTVINTSRWTPGIYVVSTYHGAVAKVILQ